MSDMTLNIQQQIKEAFESKAALNIIGGNTKSWYGRTPTGEPLNIGEHSGITSHQPSELVITARAGTKLSEITDALDIHRQRLPFDPPYFGEDATLGGTVACNFSGPRRPYAGSCRDFILGCTILNGKGEIMQFGGEVMKNVAGFDVSRLMAGSLGTLGVLLDVSLKVLPHRLAEVTIVIEEGLSSSIETMSRWAGTPLPVTAMANDGKRTYFRICGTPSSVEKSRNEIGGELFDDGLNFWKSLREHGLSYFDDPRPLYRLSVPQAAPHIEDGNDSDWFIGWGGAQRWLKSEKSFEKVQQIAAEAGGYATLFRNGDQDGEVFAPLNPSLMKIHNNLKTAFDPAAILNPGRMYGNL